jgi:hypothetical protein
MCDFPHMRAPVASVTAVPARADLGFADSDELDPRSQPHLLSVEERFRTMRVASMHVDGWLGLWPQRRDLIQDLWPRVEADVLLVQGACARKDDDQILELADTLGYAHVVNAVGERGAPMTDSNAVLSRLPLLDAHVEILPGPVPRMVAGAVVRIGRRHIRVASVHLPDPDERLIQTLQHVLSLGRPGTREILLGICLGRAALSPLAQAQLRQHLDGRELDHTSYPIAREQLLSLWDQQREDRGHELDLTPRRCDLILQQGLQAVRSGMIPLVDESGFAASGHALTWADYAI